METLNEVKIKDYIFKVNEEFEESIILSINIFKDFENLIELVLLNKKDLKINKWSYDEIVEYKRYSRWFKNNEEVFFEDENKYLILEKDGGFKII
jgi:hypothetical protein